MAGPEGFRYDVRLDRDVVIFRHGRVATTLRACCQAGHELLGPLRDARAVMARVTGNFKHGNERAAATHPRNRH